MDKQTIEYKKEIEAWLKSKDKDFDAGFELFVRFSHNRALAMQLARKRPLSKLEYELQKVVQRGWLKESRVWPIGPVVKAGNRNQEHTETETQVEKAGKKLVVTDEKISYDDLPEDMKKLYDENRETYKLMRAVHEKMKLAKKDQERAKLRAELVAMDDKIAGNWEVLDKWVENPSGEDKGEVPASAGMTEKEREPVPDPAQLGKDLNACRSYISRNVKKVATLEEKKREALMAKLAERVQTLQKHHAEVKEETRKELEKLGLWNNE